MAKKLNAKHQRPENGNGNGQTQTFFFTAPTATNVQLVGDFTHWQQKPINLQKGADGTWQTTVELDAGTHRYRFLVDGQWRDDPECALRESNPYGGQDSVRKVA
jgi:1,4-alpha-glucan branching enzyme